MTPTTTPATYAPAPASKRMLSYLIDFAVVAAASIACWLLLGSWVLGVLVAVELYVVVGLLRARTGLTLGGWITRTPAIQAGTEHAPGFGPQAVRWLLLGLLHLTAVGPVITIGLSKDGQDWIDRIAGTASVTARRRTVPVTAGVNAPAPRPVPARPVPGPPTAPVAQLQQTQFRPGPPPTAPLPTTPPAVGPLPAATGATPQPPGPPATAKPIATRPGVVTGYRPPPAALRQPATSGPRPTGWYVLLDDGGRHPVTSILAIGRQPAAVPGEGQVTLPDDTLSISRTHVRVGVDAEGLWVEDAHSANGTMMTAPGKPATQLAPGRRVHVTAGTTLAIGDRRITVVAAEITA